jgi:hypothetical protein
MKKFLIAILVFLYLSSSVGATVHLHYCMDKLVDWGLWNNKSGKCGNCGMDKSEAKDNGCCKDEQKQVKLENDHKAASGYQVMQLLSVTILDSFFELSLINLPSVTEENPLSHAPPRSCSIAAYIRYRVFRI